MGFDFEEEYDWMRLVASLGTAGKMWSSAYQKEVGNLTRWSQEALVLLRARQIDKGYLLLEKVREGRGPLEGKNAAIFHVIGRFYYGALAYYHYCREELDESEIVMLKVSESIRMAIEAERALLPLAALVLDVWLKQAQISRERHDWRRMREQIIEIKEAVKDCHPLCMLGGQAPIYHSTIARTILANGAVEDRLERPLQYLTDSMVRLEMVNRIAAGLYRIPGFLIPYP